MLKSLVAIVALAGAMQTQPAFQRGDLVKLQGVDKPVTFKVVAIPKDRIRADDTGVYVNDVAVTGFSKEFLTRFRREPSVVPEGQYFLMGERRVNNDVTELAGLFPASALEKAR
jgi:hypothetical protein